MNKVNRHYSADMRTEEELQEQLRGLREIVAVLYVCGIDYYLSAGTMLGAVRDGDFIPWDWNVSVACPAEQFDHQYDRLVKIFTDKGYEVQQRIKKGFYAINIYKAGVKYVIESLKLVGNYRELPMHKIPVRFFTGRAVAKIRGHEFYITENAEEFFEWYYGADWRTPKQATGRDDCITGNSKKKRGEP